MITNKYFIIVSKLFCTIDCICYFYKINKSPIYIIMKQKITITIVLLAIFAQSIAQNTLNLDPTGSSRFTVTDKVWPSNVGEADVCMWNDDKLSAFTITIDDNIEPEVPFWDSMIDKYGFNFTWFVITEADPAYNVSNWSLYNGVAAKGSQINGHDDRNWYNNPDSGAGEVNPTDAEYLSRLQTTQTKVNTEVTSGNNDCLTYAYPYGEGNETEMRKVFIANRGTTGLLNNHDIVDYLNVNSVSSHFLYPDDTKRDTYILPLMNTTSTLYGTNYYRGWGSTHFHAINGVANETLVDEFLQYLTDKPDLWVAGFTEVAQYSQSFATHNLTVDNVAATEIKFTLTDDMLDAVFYFPLSVKIRIDNSWVSISATQNGSSVDAQIINNGSNKYALVKAVPDAGQVTITGVADSDPAIITPVIGDKSMIEGETLQVDFAASTIGGDAISFTATNLPSFAVLTDNGDDTGNIVFTPIISEAGDYQDIAVIAYNGRSYASQLFNLSVSPDGGGNPTTSYDINPTGDGIISDVSNLAEGSTNPWLNGNGIDGTIVLKVGQSASTGAGFTTNAIIPFQLPVRPAGKLVVSANLNVNIAYIRHWISSDIDLYGLPYSSVSTISPSDFYDQSFADPSGSVTGIQDAYIIRDISGTEPLGTEIFTDRLVDSNAIGDAALVAYINAQYDAGAVAGDYVFLRLSVDAASGSVGAHYYGISDESTAEAPVLSLEIENVLGVDSYEKTALGLYPNPVTNGRLYVSIDGFSNEARLDIYSITGQLVHTEKIEVNSRNSFETQLNLRTGFYIVKLEDGERSETQKLIVQ